MWDQWPHAAPQVFIAARRGQQHPLLRLNGDWSFQPGDSSSQGGEDLSQIGQRVSRHEALEIVQSPTNRLSALASANATGVKHIGDLVVQPETCERHVVAAYEQCSFGFADRHDEFWMKGTGNLDRNERVVEPCTTRASVLTRKRLRALAGVNQ